MPFAVQIASVMARSIRLAILLCVASTLASNLHTRSTYAVKDSHHVPSRWTNVGPANPLQEIELQIGLKQGNFGELHRHLYEGMRLY
jgi:tripeptidyl-peptidase-1